MRLVSFFENIGWEELREQKSVLFQVTNLLSDLGNHRGAEKVEGLIMLIDELQDTAVDVLGFEEEEVFGEQEGE